MPRQLLLRFSWPIT